MTFPESRKLFKRAKFSKSSQKGRKFKLVTFNWNSSGNEKYKSWRDEIFDSVFIIGDNDFVYFNMDSAIILKNHDFLLVPLPENYWEELLF